MVDSLKHKVVHGVYWTLMERFSTQAVSFVVTLVLARLLTPGDYGTVALLSIFLAIAGVFVDSGFGSALIQRKNTTALDFNSVFYFSVAISLVVYLILFFVAPLVADFYGTPILAPILRVASINIILNAIASIQNAELSRKMLFHLSFRISLISSITSAIVGISMAFMGYGPWALVWSSFAGSFSGVIARWTFIGWRPRLMFSFHALKSLFSYGWKLVASSLLEAIYSNLYGLLIGKLYSRVDLAFVNKGQHMPQLIMDSVNGTLGRVAFPALAQLQDDKVKLREAMRRMIVCSTYLVFPLMTITAICARPIVYLLFGAKWLPCVPYMQLACFTFALWPFHTINLQGIQALGRSDIFLRLEIIKKIIGVTVMAIFATRGPFAFMAGTALTLAPLGVIINSFPNRKLLGYNIEMQLRDVASSAMLCAVVATALIGISFIWNYLYPVWTQPNFFAVLFFCIVQGLIGMSLYLFLSKIVKVEAYSEYGKIIVAGANKIGNDKIKALAQCMV